MADVKNTKTLVIGGGLVVVLLVIAFFVYGSGSSNPPPVPPKQTTAERSVDELEAPRTATAGLDEGTPSEGGRARLDEPIDSTAHKEVSRDSGESKKKEGKKRRSGRRKPEAEEEEEEEETPRPKPSDKKVRGPG